MFSFEACVHDFIIDSSSESHNLNIKKSKHQTTELIDLYHFQCNLSIKVHNQLRFLIRFERRDKSHHYAK
jgi:hypothetical protein